MQTTQSQVLQQQLAELCAQSGLAQPGFFRLPTEVDGMTHGISVAIPLSDTVIAEVAKGGVPTHSYFHHYRTVNTYLDGCMLRLGLLLQAEGWRYLPVEASQSVPSDDDPNGFHGRFSHKQGACLAGLGCMGSSGLFLHSRYGPRLRLGTLLTDCPLTEESPAPVENTTCAGCMLCASACPAQAIHGRLYTPDLPEWSLVDPALCSKHMKRAYQKIGRGAVCGICMAVCPYGK